MKLPATHGYYALFFCIVSSITISSCMLRSDQVRLSYPLEGPLKNYSPKAHQTPPILPKERGRVILEAFHYRPEDRAVIGDKSIFFYGRTALLTTPDNVANWVTQAVTIELGKAGYQVLAFSTASDASSVPVIKCDIAIVRTGNSASLDMLNTYEAYVALDVLVTRRSELILKTGFSGFGSAGVSGLGGIFDNATSEGYAYSLQVALADVIQQFIFSLNASLDKENVTKATDTDTHE